MNFVGRVTKNAKVETLKDERKVVNFTIAINDWYKPKGQEKGIQTTTYINCSYWISTAIAEQLRKGTLVEISGRLSVNAYMGGNNEAKASLNCHANTIKIHQTAKNEDAPKKEEMVTEPIDDLPF